MKDIVKEIPNKIDYEKYVLSNGLTVVLVPDKKLLTVLVDMFVKVGSQYEPDNIAGISHFLEHMSFKGTTTHPTNLELIMPLDSVGSSYNAGTGFDMTDYYVMCGHQFIDRAVNFISDIFQNSIFPEVEFEREKGVVLEEIRMYEDMPQSKVEELFFELMYGKQGAGRSIAGSEKTVKGTTRKNMLDYYHKYYGTKNAYLFIGGNFDKKEAKKLISKYFKKAKPGKSFSYPKTRINQKSPRILMFKKDTKETHFILGFHGFPLFNEKNYTLNIIDELLSGGFASRLWQLVREKLGGAYYINSSIESFLDRGIFIVRGGIYSSRAEIILSEIVKEVKSLKEKLISKEELEKVKNYIIGKLFMKMDQPYNLKDYLILPTLYNKPVKTPKQELEKILKITPEDVRKMACKIFTKKNINLAMVTSLEGKEKFLNILNKI